MGYMIKRIEQTRMLQIDGKQWKDLIIHQEVTWCYFQISSSFIPKLHVPAPTSDNWYDVILAS